MGTYRRDEADKDPEQTREWIESLEAVVATEGQERARYVLKRVMQSARRHRVVPVGPLTTDFVNTIPRQEEAPFPGDEEMEKRIRRIVRWNAVAMVHRANKRFPGIGGHLSTYASSASLYEVGFNHFFRGKEHAGGGDQVYYQGHAAPGMYARSFLEGRISIEMMEHFRREVERGTGLSSYPHPRLMSNYWEYPTVSMGLGPLSAIYEARFNRYLHNRGIIDTSQARVWAFLGDGESDEPEALGSLTIAAREQLDNLTFVVNCNLQRLDGPVRGNGKIIQELEGVFRGAGWHVIKVIWGPEWDDLLEKDTEGVLRRRMNEVLDGQWQKYATASGDYTRKHFFGTDPRLAAMVEHLSDEQIRKAASRRAQLQKGVCGVQARDRDHRAADGDPVSHGQGLDPRRALRGQQRHPPEEEDGEGRAARLPRHAPPAGSRRQAGGRALLSSRNGEPRGRVSARAAPCAWRRGPEAPHIRERRHQAAERRRRLRRILRGHEEGRGLDHDGVRAALVEVAPRQGNRSAHRAHHSGRGAHLRYGRALLQVGIYSSRGQLYEPVDKGKLLYYRESKDGQVLEEGITEAGSMASFIAAATSYAVHGEPMIPFYIFYSMFGFQRTGDQMWAAGDSMARGFLLGGTAGRTTLNGEGLQHEDGHSPVLMSVIPNAVVLRRRVRLRARRHHPRRPASHAARAGKRHLLHHAAERELHHAAHARGREGRHPARYLPLRPGGKAGQDARAALRQWLHPERGAARPGDPRRQVRRVGGRVERHQLPAAQAQTRSAASDTTGCIPKRSRSCRTSSSALDGVRGPVHRRLATT